MNDGTARLSTLLVAASSLSSHYQDRTTSSNPYRLQSTTTWSRANRFRSLLQSRSTDPVQIREHGADSIGISSVTALQLRSPYQSTKPSQPNSVLGLGAFVAQHARLIKSTTTRQLILGNTLDLRLQSVFIIHLYSPSARQLLSLAQPPDTRGTFYLRLPPFRYSDIHAEIRTRNQQPP